MRVQYPALNGVRNCTVKEQYQVFKKLVILVWLSVMLGLSLPMQSRVGADEAVQCDAPETEQRTRYDLHATLNWALRTVAVNQTIYYRNDHNTPLTELVLHAETQRIQRPAMEIQNVFAENGTPLLGNSSYDETRLTIPLPEAVGINCEAVVRLQFTLNLGELSGSNPYGWLAYTPRQTNLSHWFPMVAPYGLMAEDEWYNPPPHRIGEQSLTELSDFDLIFELENAPNSLAVIAPGSVTQSKGNVWHIIHQNARDLALSFSTQYKLTRERVGDVMLDFYTFTSTSQRAVEQAVTNATQAFNLYEEVYGAYPYQRLVLIEGDFPDGMELSGVVFISTDWFSSWNGTPVHWLTAITVHEVAHQWFYASIATDQAMYPYLDEALATYSELIYFEHYHPDLVDDWWDFRINLYSLGDDPVDSSVYEYTLWRPYINTVYFRGVWMLDEIRFTIGDNAFYKWLATYYTENAESIATPADFWGAMSGIGYDSTAHIRAQYLTKADVLAE